MKRMPMMGLLLIAALSLCAVAIAEADGVDEAVIDRFTDVWVDDGLAVEISYYEDEGAFSCSAVLSGGGDNDDANVWRYGVCRYDAESDSIICEDGVRAYEYFDEAASELVSEPVVEGLTAEFYFDGGGDVLFWNDSEGLAKRFELVRLSVAEEEEWNEAQAFLGRWGYGRATIDILPNDDAAYHVEITWANSAAEVVEWNYDCCYDADTKRMKNYEPGVKAVVTYGVDGEITDRKVEYEDGEASFYMDGEDILIWEDAKENAGEDIRFERGIL